MQNKEIQTKSKQTCLKNHGVEYPMQNGEILLKGIKTRFKIEKYGNSALEYQGSYEKYFLEKIEEKGLLNNVSKGKLYNYILHGEKHVYHSDYWFNNFVVEIKSTWTYNKNGTNKELELENEAKWQTVKDSGDNIIVLFSKKK